MFWMRQNTRKKVWQRKWSVYFWKVANIYGQFHAVCVFTVYTNFIKLLFLNFFNFDCLYLHFGLNKSHLGVKALCLRKCLPHQTGRVAACPSTCPLGLPSLLLMSSCQRLWPAGEVTQSWNWTENLQSINSLFLSSDRHFDLTCHVQLKWKLCIHVN